MADLLGIQAAIKELEKVLPDETAQVFNRLDLSVQSAVQQLEDLEIVVSFRKKTP